MTVSFLRRGLLEKCPDQRGITVLVSVESALNAT